VNYKDRMNYPKWLMAVGMSCLAIAITTPWFFHPATQLARNASHALCGFLVGLSIVLNLQSVRLSGRQRRIPPNQSLPVSAS